MSSRQRYTIKVPYSGSVGYTYPASEHGGSGTKHYSGVETVDITINLDTEHFDQSVHNTKSALAGVAGALSVAEAAQVHAIRESSDKIVRSAQRGIFSIIKSELSSQISEFASTLKSLTGLLVEQAQAIDKIHQQMVYDFQQIKQRYLRVFDELDRELITRVNELDAPAFRLSSHSMHDVVDAPYLRHAARLVAHTQDEHGVALKLQCARTKRRAAQAIDELGQARSHVAAYADAMDRVVDTVQGGSHLLMPVVYDIERDIDSGVRRIRVYDGALEGGDAVRRSVISFVVQRPETAWNDLPASGKSELDAQFMRCVDRYASENAGSEDEQRQSMLELAVGMYHRTRVQTTYGNQS